MATLSFFFMALSRRWVDRWEATARWRARSTAPGEATEAQRHRERKEGSRDEATFVCDRASGGSGGDRGERGGAAQGPVPDPLRGMEALRRPSLARRVAVLGREA